MATLADSVAKTAPLTAADLALVKIHGSKAGYTSFGRAMRNNYIVVDKTLVCKAFFDAEHKLVRVCAPTTFGKTFNLSIIRKFFGFFTRYDVPNNGVYAHWYGSKLTDELDPKQACAERMKLFETSLLYQQAPAFFAQHFGSYPVIYIRYGEHPSYSLGRAYRELTAPLLDATYYWIRAFVPDQLDSTQREQLDKLTKMHEDISGKFRGRDAELEGCADAPGMLFACLSEFVTSMLNSSYVLKAMFAGNYVVPLEIDSKNILDVVPATYNCNQIQATADLNSEYTLGAMFGFANPEVAELMKIDFDHGESSCFIWPSLQLKDNHCASAADAIHNFVLDPLVYPDAVRTEASIDSFVSLTLYLGYLTVGVDNSLRIPNNGMRDLWEQIRLMATFGTWDQIQQDIAQHQLIDSLFSGKAGIVHDDFESALKQLSSDCDSYSDAARLELACRYVASGLTLSKYAATKNQVNVVYDYQFLLKPQFGKTWAIELLPFGRYNQRLVVLFHFASGRSENAASSADAFEQLAVDSLNTIVDNGDAQPFAHCNVRLDLGVAFGNETVIVKQRLWKRISDDQMDTSESAGNHENLRLSDGESVAEWEQRLRAMDSRGWSDSLGWMTQSTDQE
ncbi:hypothetical protein H4S01_001034 [Coemansia sp. RSA 2610]|nr:hypothetical protein H4S01_001034 [Coemansia sp. RSA 2610]